MYYYWILIAEVFYQKIFLDFNKEDMNNIKFSETQLQKINILKIVLYMSFLLN